MPNSLWYFTFFPTQIPTRVIWWRLAVLQRASKQQNSGLKANTWEYPQYISYEFPLGRHFCFAKASAPRWQRFWYPSAEQSDMMVPHSGRQRAGRGRATERWLPNDSKYASLGCANSHNVARCLTAAWSHSTAGDSFQRCANLVY